MTPLTDITRVVPPTSRATVTHRNYDRKGNTQSPGRVNKVGIMWANYFGINNALRVQSPVLLHMKVSTHEGAPNIDDPVGGTFR